MDNLDTELRKHKFVTFIEDHYTPLGVIRSLGEMGIKFDTILITNRKPYLINHSKYVSKLVIFDTYQKGLEYLIDNYCNEPLKPFVYTGCDNIVNLMDEHYDELKDKLYFYNAGAQGRCGWLQDKFNITSLGEKVGLDNPKREVVDTGVLPTKLKYPIITKVLMSILGGWKDDVFICHNEDELKEAYKKIKSPKLMLQEYVNKKGEFCMEGFSINHGQNVCIPYICNYMRVFDNSFGLYMEFTPFKNETLKNKILNLFKETGFEGIFEIEFMRGPNEETYFLEINFRASTWNYALTTGGCNMPYLWAKSMLAGRILTEEMNLTEKPFRAIVDDEIIDVVFKQHTVGIIKWFKEYFGADCHYYYNKKDPKPFWHFLVFRLMRPIQKKLGIFNNQRIS